VCVQTCPTTTLPRAGEDAPAPAPRPGRALGVALLCLLGLALLWLVAELVPGVRVRDAALLQHLTDLSGPRVDPLARRAIHLLDPLVVLFWGLALVLFALARRRGREALAVCVIFVAAPLSADFLKPLLAHSHPNAGSIHIGAPSWPSGHATAAMALALCAALVAPRRARPLVAAVGAAFAAAVGCALLIRAWHMPSDVLGGYLLAGLWMAVAVACLRAAERRWPRPHLSEPDALGAGSRLTVPAVGTGGSQPGQRAEAEGRSAVLL
jgi:membrane-associated phospholipid phosphatase